MDKSLLTNKLNLLDIDFNPTYSQLYIHPEEGESFFINDKLNDIKYDINNINDTIITFSNNVSNLLSSTINRLELINTQIINEKERLQDIKMLCNKFTDFDKVILINKDNIELYGDCNYSNGIFSAKIDSFKEINLNLNHVSGNGLEGNKYVYKNYAYIEDSLDTTKHNALFDNSIATYWEYQRITASSTEKDLLNDFYMDSEEAKCTLVLSSDEKMNELILSTDIENIKIIGMQYSNNSIDYYDIPIPTITINTKLDCYNNTGYIYGSGVLSVPNCKYLKITFQSNGSTNDEMAFEKTLFVDESFNEEEINRTYTETVLVKSAKRHLIKLNDIKAYNNVYDKNSYFTTSQLIEDNTVYSIGIFANVYIPDGLSRDSVSFVLTVNGIDYEVSPINENNSNTSNIKIIRYSQGSSKAKYTELTNEIITSAYLTVKIKSIKNLTPYINNIKVLLGGEI